MSSSDQRVGRGKAKPLHWLDTDKRIRTWMGKHGIALTAKAHRGLVDLILRMQREAQRG